MFNFNSRYATIREVTHTLADGRQVRYKRRRLIPAASPQPGAETVTVRQGDRPDTLAAQHLGDATQFWQLCDANNLLSPWELTDRTGTRIYLSQERAEYE